MADIDELLDRLDGLAPERRRLLAATLRDRGAQFGLHPLSPAERRLWFLSRLDGDLPSYHVSYGFRLAGPLRIGALRDALQTIVDRHEMLRVRFLDIDGEPYQAVQPELPLPLSLRRWRGDPARRDAVAQALLDRESRLPFDLRRGPVLRAGVVELAEQDHLFLLTLHHICCDGWSMALLFDELELLYRAGCGGPPARLPPVPVRYVDLARRQLAELAAQAGGADLDYWVRQLAGAPATLDLPLDRPRPAQPSGRGDTLVELWPPELVAEVETFRRRQGLTAFTVLLAAFDALLIARSGQHDVTVGVPVANRTRADIESVFGFFVNMLPIRVDAAAVGTFAELLELVRDAVTGAQEHQDLPFDLLVQARAGSRGPSANPLFQVAFVVQEGATEELVLDGLRVRRLVARTGTTKFDLTLTLTPVADGMLALLEYDSDLFERATAAGLLADLRTLVAAALRDPGRPLADLLPHPRAARR
jgi:hypothetical protein